MECFNRADISIPIDKVSMLLKVNCVDSLVGLYTLISSNELDGSISIFKIYKVPSR